MSKRILIVENDQDTIHQIKEVLMIGDVSFDVVENGQQAKDLIDNQPYDLIVSGVMISKVHGFELASYTAANYPDTKIILISSVYKGMEYQQRALNQYKAHGYLEKPFDNNTLREMVEEVVSPDFLEHPATSSVEGKASIGRMADQREGASGSPSEVQKTLDDLVLPEDSFKTKSDFKNLDREIAYKFKHTLQELGISEDRIDKRGNRNLDRKALSHSGYPKAEGKKKGKLKKLRNKKK